MSNETWLQRKLKSFAGRVGYETERLSLSVTEQIESELATADTTRAELARTLQVSKGYVTRVLNGAPNMTLRTLVSVASAIGCRVSITVSKQDVRVAAEQQNIREFDTFLRKRQAIGCVDGITPAAMMAGFKPFVPPPPVPEKQNAAA
jgi:transcriptional regulator with XRE-family HTH domain